MTESSMISRWSGRQIWLVYAVVSLCVAILLALLRPHINQPEKIFITAGGTTRAMTDEEYLPILQKLVTPVQNENGQWVAYTVLMPAYVKLRETVKHRQLYRGLVVFAIMLSALIGVSCLLKYWRLRHETPR